MSEAQHIAGGQLPAILPAMQAVMDSVREIAKRDRNTQQNYSFRGVDAVVNAIGPRLREHKIVIKSEVVDVETGTVEVGEKRTRMTSVRPTMRYTFVSTEDGSEFPVEALGEAFDSGDKATPKASSVAYRTAMLQTFCIPTDDPEPDQAVYHQSAQEIPEGCDAASILDRVRRAVDEETLNRAARIAVTYHQGEILGTLRDAIQGRRAKIKRAIEQGQEILPEPEEAPQGEPSQAGGR